MIDLIVGFIVFILLLLWTVFIVILNSHKDDIWYVIYYRMNWLKEEANKK